MLSVVELKLQGALNQKFLPSNPFLEILHIAPAVHVHQYLYLRI